MITAFIVSFIIIFGYIGYAVWRCGVPASISETYYLLQERGRWNGIFTLSLLFGAFLALIPLIKVSGDIQPLASFMCAAVMFIGMTPQFGRPVESNVHYVATGVGAIAALVWSALVMPYSWIGTIVAIASAIYLSVRRPESWLFWTEVCILGIVYILGTIGLIFG